MTVFNRISLLLADFSWKFGTRPLTESNSFLWHYLADLGHNHLATLAAWKIHSDCHATMRTGWSIQRVKLETRMPCPHTCSDVFF